MIGSEQVDLHHRGTLQLMQEAGEISPAKRAPRRPTA
jgi:hypothetical protein